MPHYAFMSFPRKEKTARLLLPLPLAETYLYRLPEGVSPPLGSFLRVPFGARRLDGVVWEGEGGGGVGGGVGGAKKTIPSHALKEIAAIHPVPPLSASHRRFLDWVARYTLTPKGAILKLTLSSSALLRAPTSPSLLEPDKSALGALDTAKLTPKERLILEKALFPATAADMAKSAGVSVGVAARMKKKGLLRPAQPPPAPPAPASRRAAAASEEKTRLILSAAQEKAAAALRAALRDKIFAPFLLDGVTGAGKTEVYAEGVKEALRQGKQALLLLPEIALTQHLLKRFQSRFPKETLLWHSSISEGRRRAVWRAVSEARPCLVIGARSALFLPFSRLGFVVVDEEHDPAYKQEEIVFYHARDMAIARGFLDKFPVILSSATPSLESLVNAKRGRYRHLLLPKRVGLARLPDVASVDLRAHPPPSGRWLSPPLRAALQETLARQEQALLFLNRRGYAPLTLCRACGTHFACPDCSAWLVEHKSGGSGGGGGRLLCHHCGHQIPSFRLCPSCGAEDSRASCGPGVERLMEETRDLFPEARLACLSGDLPKGMAARRALLEAMEKREIDILIGTQIIAKGLHFPRLTFVGVVDADLGLANSDLRAAERSFQLLQQVAGRAGRETRPGRALLQTVMPDHPVMRALAGGGREDFFRAEMTARRERHMPPFGRLAAVIVSGREAAAAEEAARILASLAPKTEGARCLGPAPAPLFRLRRWFRFRLLVKAELGVDLPSYMRAWKARWPNLSRLRLVVDMDPQSFA